MPYKEVWIDEDDLDEYEDQKLIDELENRGWWVSPEKNWEPPEEFIKEEKDWLIEMITISNLDDKNLIAREIYEKLRRT